MYVSYVKWGGGLRFESQLPSRNKGHWLSTQLERFRAAVVSWNHLTGGPTIFADGQRQGEMSEWGGRLGLPRFQLAQIPIVIPFWDEARDWIDDMPQHVRKLQMAGPQKEAWRKVPLGIADSQFEIPPLVARPVACPTPVQTTTHPEAECTSVAYGGSACLDMAE